MKDLLYAFTPDAFEFGQLFPPYGKAFYLYVAQGMTP